MAADDDGGGGPLPLARRTLLKAGILGAAGAAGAYALGGLDSEPEPASTEPVEADRAAELAETYAPAIHFGRRERWFPTDPRRYAIERDGESVVDGFAALDGYTREFAEAGEPPAPTAFYHVVEYPDDPLVVVQYWLYSAFDQFATNFHWHDWELLQVFVDTGADEPVLFAASAHARGVPNNEHLDPERSRPAIISEVGSHSSALGVNGRPRSFQRLPTPDLPADITNRVLAVADVVEAPPIAYGLPRDEGMVLPFAIPELDGDPIHEHERLPNVEADDLLPDALTVRQYDALAAPPTDIPTREHGTTWRHAGDDADADRRYELVPTSAVEHLAAFTGPQLSFEFPVPGFAEDAVASHLTSAGLPWEQDRYERPTADVTDPPHRAALVDRYPSVGAGGSATLIVGVLREAEPADEAPDGQGVATTAPGSDGFCLLESEAPTAVPTWSNVVAFQGISSGDHRLTVDGPGYAPYAERFGVEEDRDAPHRVGVDGAVTLVPRRDATKVRGDPGDTTLSRVAFEDDFGGRLYDARPDEDGRFAVYAHRDGAYTVEVRDEADLPGAARVNPGPDQREVTLEDLATGKASLARFVADLLDETFGQSTVAVESGDVPRDVGTGNVSVTDDTTNPTADLIDGASTNQVTNGSTTNGTSDGSTTDETTDDTTTNETADGSTNGTADGSTNGTADGADATATATETATPADTATSTDTATPTDTPMPTDTATPTDDGPIPDGTEVTGLVDGFGTALSAARRAATAAEEGNPRAANRRLEAVRRLLAGIERALDARAASLPDEVVRLFRRRLELLDERVEQALATPLG